ncbi:hypothetical protein [uncultured Kordia sp.]|uniref:hypothetical protein n=1 Tax=uncultured Kordia sp. TaxID=507699 RepID=UPI0026290F65|nr:hypothetical protein [uncultured Kordia sp.]
MNITQRKAIYYFQSYTDYFWQWETDYMFTSDVIENAYDYHGGINCISIPDGITVAYKEQIEEILKAISSNDLPPFGALILTFLATNSGEVSKAIDEQFKKIQKTFEDDLLFKHVYFEEAQRFLETLITLPKKYKKGKNRIDLFIFLFQKVKHGLSNKYADAIVSCIQNKAFELNQCSRQTEITMSALSKDFNSLALLHERFPTVNALLTAWEKILPVPVDPEDTEIETISEQPDLIQQLIEDPKTFFMGSLIKRIWSGIQLPMHYVHPGEMPLGGISDVTNKGKFDNLLTSEFANDDLIFLHRIANKEALFIRRETTPEEDLRTRIFLIDTTIKNWGTPKILSFATAFAFMHHPKNEMTFQSYAIGEKCAKLAFDEKIDIIEGLQVTSPILDASSAIIQFIDTCEEENIEVTLFTSPKTLEHAAMQRIFNLHHDKFGGVITADTEGNIDVYKLKNGAKRLVKHIQLPLQELWAHPPNTRRRKLLKTQKEAPIIEYPLLYGYPNGYLTHFFSVDTGYVLRKRGAVYRMNGYDKGFDLVRTDVRFVSGMKKPLNATIFDDELITISCSASDKIIVKSESQTKTFTGDYDVQYRSSIKNALVHQNELYFITRKYYSDDPVYLKIDFKHKFIDEITTPSSELKKDYDTCISNYFPYFPGSIFTKIKSIAVTNSLELIFNNIHRLHISDDYLLFQLNREEEGYLSNAEYIDRTEFRFSNGNKIAIDKKGMLTFLSSDPAVKTFYLVSYIEISLAMATDTEFAGNEYFLPENSQLKVISVKEFKRKHIDPFIDNCIII